MQLLFWDYSFYTKLQKDSNLVNSLFEEDMLKPFIVQLDNPYSFLWTFALFLNLNYRTKLIKTDEIYLVPLDSHSFAYTSFLVISGSDFKNCEIKKKLNKFQQLQVLMVTQKKRFVSKTFGF